MSSVFNLNWLRNMLVSSTPLSNFPTSLPKFKEPEHFPSCESPSQSLLLLAAGESYPRERSGKSRVTSVSCAFANCHGLHRDYLILAFNPMRKVTLITVCRWGKWGRVASRAVPQAKCRAGFKPRWGRNGQLAQSTSSETLKTEKLKTLLPRLPGSQDLAD